MAPENTSATPTTETGEQPKQRVSVSDERKAHPSSANARRMSSAAKTDDSNQSPSPQTDNPTQNATAQCRDDKAAPKKRSIRKETKRASEAPIDAPKASFRPSREYHSAEDVQAAVDEMREFFQTGATMPLHYRRSILVKLRAYLKKHEKEALQALTDDLGKSNFEGYATELGIVYDEIRFCLSKMYGWAKPKRVPTPLAHFPSSSKIYASPYGVAAVLSPWNYPLQLALVPMIDALTAGNCVVLKPSRTSQSTSTFLQKLCEEVFDEHLVRCLPGSGEMNDWILNVHFDKIFFTGSPAIGKQIMHAAAENLTDVTLELGGKSPCIIASDANIKRAAQRVAWGKCINSGQTCVAPDYFLVHESVADAFADELATYLLQYYGKRILQCDYYPHMINEHHFNRVCGLIDNHGPKTRIAFGGGRDRSTLRIEPTILTGVTLDDPVMKEEIFGPVIPIITWSELDEVFSHVRNFGHPLACYLFSESKVLQEQIIQAIPFGGATINDVVIHLANNHMGFGGFGDSGMGAYHGKQGFDCFTHYKSTLRKSTKIEIPVRVPPFTKAKSIILKLMMR